MADFVRNGGRFALEHAHWGGYPHWRCIANVRHRQKVFKSHLRLPKMVALIPKVEQRKICKIFGIDDLGRYAVIKEPITSEKSKQRRLFDDFK